MNHNVLFIYILQVFYNKNLVRRIARSRCEFEINYALKNNDLENNISKEIQNLPLETKSCMVSEKVEISKTYEKEFIKTIGNKLFSGERHGRDLGICSGGKRSTLQSTQHVQFRISRSISYSISVFQYHHQNLFSGPCYKVQ